MTAAPLVSVITPTWQRPRLLWERCIPSVAAQTYRPVEHVIASDGPDPDLAAKCAAYDLDYWGDEPRLTYVELPEHDPAPHWGNAARLAGLAKASGEIIAYNDDDDALRPHHLAILVAALDRTGTGFVYSQMLSHLTGETLIGLPSPQAGHIGTPMIVHRRELLDVATWGASDHMEDWQLVERWLAAGVTYEFVPEITVDVWPSQFHPTG